MTSCECLRVLLSPPNPTILSKARTTKVYITRLQHLSRRHHVLPQPQFAALGARADPRLMFSPTLTAMPCARTRTQRRVEEVREGDKAGERARAREKGREREREPEGHLSISAGVKWAGACAVLLRTAALSLTPDAAGAPHPRTLLRLATAGVPRRRGPLALGPPRSSVEAYVLIWSARGNGRMSSADGERWSRAAHERDHR